MWLWLLVLLSLFWFVSLLTTKKLTSNQFIAVPSAIALCKIFLKSERSLCCGKHD
ncbi:hypothetical protein PQG02_00845 [Nostoc sp. UHCC 0926]|uniref:hypothetical protein n=1 Tax=unclassified Nostoc TaxID=2593658 RepID=UPI0023631052|nr:hypothetical protein [Nostoc sp. UHCC 0926]WDD32991.1 hypothetical protein PQG02_00845 [Nostoc sp. UHCC 0926]